MDKFEREFLKAFEPERRRLEALLNSIIHEVATMKDWDGSEIEEARSILKERLEAAGFTPSREDLETALYVIEEEENEEESN